MVDFAIISRIAPPIEQMLRKAQPMPQAMHESQPFNSRNSKVAVRCVFSVKDNKRSTLLFLFLALFVVYKELSNQIFQNNKCSCKFWQKML